MGVQTTANKDIYHIGKNSMNKLYLNKRRSWSYTSKRSWYVAVCPKRRSGSTAPFGGRKRRKVGNSYT